MAFGTLSIADLLATTQQSVAEVGEQNIWMSVQEALRVHNARTDEVVSTFAEVSTDRQRRYGGPSSMTPEKLSISGIPGPQKIAAGDTVGFPLEITGVGVQWNLRAFENMAASEFAAQFLAALDADLRGMEAELKKALFHSTNYTFTDALVDNVSLAVKRLVNADSASIPTGPDGTTFNGATHTHYLATASFVAGDLTSLINTVIEHHNVGRVRVAINSAQETAVRALTGFAAYIDARLVIPGGSTTTTARGSLDMMNTFDREIGVFGAAEIVVKPWVPANYMIAWVEGAPKPLVMRKRNDRRGAFATAYEDERFPLRCRTMEREYGFGVWTRTNAAVLYTGGGTYTDPTIAA